MPTTSRRGFLKGAAASSLLLPALESGAFHTESSSAGLANPIFAYEFGDITAEQQAKFARDYGFAGTVFDHAVKTPERLKAVDDAHIQLFFLWLTADISNNQINYEPGMEAAIQALQGRGTVVWLAIQGTNTGAGAEDRMIQAIHRVSDLASRCNLRVALYPHYGFYLARFRDVVRAAQRAGRSNVGTTFNLCHELRSGFDPDFHQLLDSSIPSLYAVTINGADQKGTDWNTLIQPLGRGDFDVAALVRTIAGAGYRGPLGVQCYGLKGDPAVYLKQSMSAWRDISAQAASEAS